MSSQEWDEGLCPDTVILDMLANVGEKKADEFFTMRSSGTAEELVKSITVRFILNIHKAFWRI